MLNLILAFDIVTSGIKTSLVNLDGIIVDSATSPHQTWFTHSDWAEQEPEDWRNSVCRNTRTLVEKHHVITGNIVAVGVSGHMTGRVPVDSSGRALYKALIHSDTYPVEQFDLVKEL